MSTIIVTLFIHHILKVKPCSLVFTSVQWNLGYGHPCSVLNDFLYRIVLVGPCNIMVTRGRNMPKLPLVRRISDMLKTTCPPTCPLVQVLVHFVGPKEIILVLQPFLIYHNENIIIYCTAHIKYSIHTCA